MTCTRMMGAIVCTGGPDMKIVDAKGKLWRFEMHHYLGPMPLTAKTGEPMENPPPESSPFWECVSFWIQQGQKVNSLGTCEWKRPKIRDMKHIGGNHYLLEPMQDSQPND